MSSNGNSTIKSHSPESSFPVDSQMNLFNINSYDKIRRRILFILIAALLLMVLIIVIYLELRKPSLINLSSSHLLNRWDQIDGIIQRNLDFILQTPHDGRNQQKTILMSSDIKWLNHLQLNATGNINKCYAQDQLILFFHYCVDESRYPILYDTECWPHSLDLYEKLIINQTARFVQEFIQFFNKFMRDSIGLKLLMNKELNQAMDYAKKIGRDCEHPQVWMQNFDPSLPSGRNDYEIWELYCLRRIRYPNLVSINSGKYYIPEYYQQRIEEQNYSMNPNEQWMLRWMEEKFLPHYRTNKILQQRYKFELNHSRIYAEKNGLDC